MRMRKKRRGEERLRALSALFVTKEDCTATLDGVFDEDRPLRLEIGCGKGEFIRKLSRRDPDYNYIAVERVGDVIVTAAEKYAEDRGLGQLDCHGGWRSPDGTVYKNERWEIPLDMRGNVRFLNCDAAELEGLFRDGAFDAVYANFSDPWTKNGYTARRLTHPDFLRQYVRLLREGGSFTFKTDNTELFDFSLEAVKNESCFDVVFETRNLHESERAESNIVTEYERNFSSQGIPINCFEAVKKSKESKEN